MKARPGDWLVIESETAEKHRRTGQITEVRNADGTPPYRVHWLDDGHVTLVFPGPNARVERHPLHGVKLHH
ncbi:MAG: DUF1918 domain-containing protein [Streptosporangiales bacterium]|nr:DUF1918 domain-containing protein [Streptosporangiales bacterium]